MDKLVLHSISISLILTPLAPPPIFNCLIVGEETRPQCLWVLCYRGVKLGVVVVLAASYTTLLSDGSALAFRSRNLSETWSPASYEWMFIIWLLSEPHNDQLTTSAE